MLEEPQILQTPARLTAFIPVVVPRERIREVMAPGREELQATVAAQGIAITGPWFTHHVRLDPAVFDFEISVPVASPVTASGRVQPGEWPAMTVARTILHGGYEQLGAAWEEFDDRVTALGHVLHPELRETYLVGPSDNPDPASWQTELVRQVVR
ncbi:MAG TPA: GyrI-like domain-containing protein [Chthoniobacteraceae bacterium]|jgi:effector-binding domain-containing protein|nr:GyrI-like domain-containing protein [Chthoniobacteraceae bacterium]